MDRIFSRIRKERDTGSTLLLVVVMTTVLSVAAGTLLKYAISERRTNKSNITFTRAQNTAESMVEYGFAELKSRWGRQTSFSADSLRSEPLVIPPTALTFFGDDDIVYDELEIVGGIVPPGEWRFLDPQDPLNQNDPQKGKLVFSRDVRIFGKAVARDSSMGRKAAFCEQTLMVRDAPLFSHAIFYNMDLEFHPGPRMDMQGPVHANGDIFVQAVNRLRFHSTLMTAGDIIYGSKARPGQVTQKGKVEVKDGSGSWVSFHKGGNKNVKDNYFDSDMGDDWRVEATDRWDGNVGSVDHGVPKMNPVGISDYVPDDPDTPENERFNPAYALIEPLVPTGDPNYKGDAVLRQKFAYKAGIVFEVSRVEWAREEEEDESGEDGDSDDDDDDDDEGSGDGDDDDDGGSSDGDDDDDDDDDSDDGGSVPVELFNESVHDYQITAYRYERTSNSNPKSPPIFDGQELKRIDLNLSEIEARIGQSLISVNRYAENAASEPVGGFYDRRQQLALDVVELDIGLLAELVSGEEVNGVADPWDGLFTNDLGNQVDWNGIVYVELPHDRSESSRNDKVMPPERDVVLRLNNGGQVPNPDFAQTGGFDAGFTLATNGQLYIKGHFNSDGLQNTGSSTETDDGRTYSSSEASAALYADSVTILSENFDDTKSKLSPSHRPAVYTEVSAGLVTGLIPTIPGEGVQSGGAHNLPRFLEDWKNTEFRYRGSLVALYESEAGTMPMTSNHSAWYSPPTRNWGYSELFAEGIYPPGAPNTRDFRRTDFRFLSEEEYNAALAAQEGFDPEESERGHGGAICVVSEFRNELGDDSFFGEGDGDDDTDDDDDDDDEGDSENSQSEDNDDDDDGDG